VNRHHLLLGLVLLYAASFRFAVLNRPFDYDAEGSGSLNGVLARSYLRFDWAHTHGMPVLSLDPARAPEIVSYPDHPPLVPLLIVPSYRFFGVGEWQTRLPIALTTLGAIVALYQLLACVASPRVGLIAAALFAATPMTLYFGGFADVVGMPLLLVTLLALYAYLRFNRSPGLQTFSLCLAAFALAGICDWPAFVLAPILAAHFFATRPRREWPWMLAFGIAACTWFAIVYAYITVATHYSWTWMADLITRRSALVGGHDYTWREWLAMAANINTTFHTLPLVAGAAIWAATFGVRRRPPSGATVARLLLAWAAVYALIGGKALYDHEWAWCVLTPGIVVAAALLLDVLPGVVIALAVLAFAAWTTFTTFRSFYPAERDRPFTPMQMAAAVEVAAPDGRDVALIVGDDTQAQLWFYGDRLLRSGIWSVEDFQCRLDDRTVDLPYNFDVQPWAARATGVVFPKIWSRTFADLHAYLRARYPLAPLSPALSAMFDVFDVRERR
jgi:hypothetical protein